MIYKIICLDLIEAKPYYKLFINISNPINNFYGWIKKIIDVILKNLSSMTSIKLKYLFIYSVKYSTYC